MLTLRLSDHGEIEAPRDAAEQIGRAGDACIKQAKLERCPALLHGRLKTGDRGLRAFGVLLALNFDQIGWDAAEDATRNDRLVDEADTHDVCAKGAGDRNGIISREVLRLTTRQVDDNVLDHGPT